MGTLTVAELRKILIRDGIVKPAEFIGCTSEEVSEVKLRQGISNLPSLYQEFLLDMGRGAGKFLEVEFFYPVLLSNKEAAVEDLEWNRETFRLSEDAFVFAENQGYEFLFFRTHNLVDDPSVYYYLEGTKKGQGTITQKWDRLSDFFIEMLEWWQKRQ